MHGRSRMTIDPRVPTMGGRSMPGFPKPGRHCLHQARSIVRCSASRMQGELHPSKNRSYGELRHLVPTFLPMMTAPMNYTSIAGGWGGGGGQGFGSRTVHKHKNRESLRFRAPPNFPPNNSNEVRQTPVNGEHKQQKKRRLGSTIMLVGTTTKSTIFEVTGPTGLLVETMRRYHLGDRGRRWSMDKNSPI